jgi:hypothetical protein
MITERALKVILKNGKSCTTHLLPYPGDEVGSTTSFIVVVKASMEAIQRFIKRSPDISLISLPAGKESPMNLGHTLDKITSSRTKLEYQYVGPDDYQQLFVLDFLNNCLVVYNSKREEVGTMYFNNMFDNWRELFYPDYIEPDSEEEHIEEPDDEEADDLDTESIREKILESIGEKALELWDAVYKDGAITDEIRIEYSGCGDSGQTDGIYLKKVDNPFARSVEEDLYNEIDELVWELIDTREPGFYNNDGGSGHIYMSPKLFKWTHDNYVTESDRTVSEEITL